MKKNIPILVTIVLSSFNSFSQKLSLADSHLLLFSKAIEKANAILSQSGFEFNKTITSQDRGINYRQFSFLQKEDNSKDKKEEIILYRQNDSTKIDQIEYSTTNFQTYSSYKKEAALTLKELGNSRVGKCTMISYRGDTLLETFENCTINGVKAYKIVMFNLLSTPFK